MVVVDEIDTVISENTPTPLLEEPLKFMHP